MAGERKIARRQPFFVLPMESPAATQSVFSLREGEGLRVLSRAAAGDEDIAALEETTLVVARLSEGQAEIEIGGYDAHIVCEPGETISLGPASFLLDQFSDNGRRRVVLRVVHAPREVAIEVMPRGESPARATGD